MPWVNDRLLSAGVMNQSVMPNPEQKGPERVGDFHANRWMVSNAHDAGVGLHRTRLYLPSQQVRFRIDDSKEKIH
jgi:hypothetical protein